MKPRAWLICALIAVMAVSLVVPAFSEGKAKTEVTIWTWSPIPRTMEKMIAAFEAKNPDIKINYTNYNFSPEYITALAAASGSNSMPDIIGLQPGSFTQQYRDYLIDLSKYSTATWGSNLTDKFYKVAVDQLKLGNPAGDQSIYIVPCETQVINIWYNKALFDQLKLKVPKTWAELKSVSQALSKKGYAPMYQGGADGWQNVNVFQMLCSQIAPGEIYTAQAGTTKWTSANMVKVMTAWKDMFDSGIIQVGALSNHAYPDGVNLFIAGKVGMMALGSWWPQEFTAPSPAKNVKNWVFDNFYLPPYEAGGKASAAIGGIDFGYGITKNAKNPDAAWKVLASFAAGEGNQQAINDLNDLSAFKKIEPQGKNIPANIKEQIRRYSSALDGALNQRLSYPEIENALQNALSGVAAGQLKPEQALAAVQDVQDKLKK